VHQVGNYYMVISLISRRGREV